MTYDDEPEESRIPFPPAPVDFVEPDPEAWQWLADFVRGIFSDGGRSLEEDFTIAQLVWFAERKLATRKPR